MTEEEFYNLKIGQRVSDSNRNDSGEVHYVYQKMEGFNNYLLKIVWDKHKGQIRAEVYRENELKFLKLDDAQ